MTMELELDLGQEFSPNQTLKVSPRLVAANYILELSSQELQQQISTELNDNPALELVEIADLPRVRHRAPGLDLSALHPASEGQLSSQHVRARQLPGYDDGRRWPQPLAQTTKSSIR